MIAGSGDAGLERRGVLEQEANRQLQGHVRDWVAQRHAKGREKSVISTVRLCTFRRCMRCGLHNACVS